ncbi:hypothetical protein HS048_10410 [Planomonospora sp. ID91781]|uniref:hypothetical protein n=1 Tax=Planomonospora sp. ID91781 TaxID=2738135 RepID=UPI0018C3B4D6|nr:hypothetical protein [Planomonospora sp. ID91781]MBG0821145.1 hypothetical protein [Planomonospora sp. ID91781]
MTAGERYERFTDLVRLGWGLHGLGACASLVLPAGGEPVLEVRTAGGGPVRITAIRRYRGRVFTWRPWWARLWRRGKWVVADADNAADIIMAEVNA